MFFLNVPVPNRWHEPELRVDIIHPVFNSVQSARCDLFVNCDWATQHKVLISRYISRYLFSILTQHIYLSTHNTAVMSVTDDQIKQFREDGAILLKNIFRSQVSKWKIVVIIKCSNFLCCIFFLTERTFWHWVSGVKSPLGGHGEEWHWGRCVSLSEDKNCRSRNLTFCYSCEEKFSESKSILWKTRT